MTPASRSAEQLPVREPKRRKRLGVVLPVVLAVPAVLGVGAAAYSRGVTNDNPAKPAAAAHPIEVIPVGSTPADVTPAGAAAPAAPAAAHPSDAGNGKFPVSVTIGKLTMANDYTGVPQTSLPVTVTNTGPLTHSFDVTIVALDKNGQRITSDTGTAANLRPGQTAQLRVLEIVNDALVKALTTATFQVQSTFAY